MDRYKRNLQLGDYAISKRTCYRYKLDGIDENITESIDSSFGKVYSHDQYDEIHTPNNTENSDMDFSNNLRTSDDEIGNSYQSSTNPTTLKEMIESKDFLQPIKTSVSISKGELFFMILKFSVSNSLTFTAMINMFKLINTIFESPVMPDSKYLADKILNPKDNAQFHAVCHNCSAYIGKFGEIESVKTCSICEIELDLKNPSNSSFFMILDPTTQVQDLIQMNETHYESVVTNQNHNDSHIEDIYDAYKYKEFVKTLPDEDKINYISACFNTDGAPKYESSQCSIWPIYLMLHELPKETRMQNLITCGLWFHRKKPNMSIFLEPFVDRMNTLNGQGISCILKNEERRLKLHILTCCVDSVARAPVQGIKQFNGHFGCNWCLHQGETCDGSIRYTLQKEAVKSRDHDETIHDMLRVTPERPIKGVKYPSPFINLSTFNIIDGFVPDYLHCCLEGVAKQLTNYHVQLMSDRDIREIDAIMNMISSPNQISRLSRPLSCRNDWKAREWENYILYYSIPVLKEHLPKDLLDHWILFVESLYILLQDRIQITEINRANVLLYTFVAKTEKYYGKKAMTFNVHQLLHISESVFNWGPLWCHSTFSFESANRHLLAAIKCSRGATFQIQRYININHITLILQEYLFPHLNESVGNYCENIIKSRAKSCYKLSEITYFHKYHHLHHNILQNLQQPDSAKFYSKIIKNGCLYESFSRYKRRSNNSFAQMNNSRFVQIVAFILNENTEEEFTICQIIRTRDCFRNQYNKLKIIDAVDNEYTIIPTNQISNICIYMDVYNVKYICPIPNSLHY